MRKRYKRPLFIFAILIILIMALMVYKQFNKNEGPSEIKVVDSIENFSYTLDARDTNLMKENYEELKSVLKEKDINYEDYALVVTKLFVIDLFTIDNKLNKYDVGGTEYIYPSALDNFKLNVQNTLYKKLESNKEKRKQKWPIVKSILNSDVTSDKYTINDQEKDCYVVSLTWDYEENLGYDDKAKITLIKEKDTLYIVEYKSGDAA